MQIFVEVKDILESAKKYGKDNVLSWNPTEFNDNKTKNKKASFDCTWIPFKLKMASGPEVPLRLKANRIIIASGAKVPSASDNEGKIKYLTIALRKFDLEEIEGGDFAPKEMKTEKEQEEENKKVKTRLTKLIKNTNECNDAMEIIDLSYQKLCDEMITAKNLGFTVRKDRKMDKKKETLEEFYRGTQIFSIRQTTREDAETKEDIELAKPLTRLKLMTAKESDLIGIDTYDKNSGTWKFAPNVFDSRKMKKDSTEAVVAQVKVKGKLQPLDVKTAPTFITYKSVVGGIIEFRDIVSSKFGLSLGNRFLELYVKRCKNSGSEQAFSKEDMQALKGSDDEEDDGDDDEDVEFHDEDDMAELEENMKDLKSSRKSGSKSKATTDKQASKASAKPTKSKVKKEEPVSDDEGSLLDEVEVEEEVEEDIEADEDN